MGAAIFWVAVAAFAEGTSVVLARRRRRLVARYAASAELRAINVDGHERSNVMVATSLHVKQR